MGSAVTAKCVYLDLLLDIPFTPWLKMCIDYKDQELYLDRLWWSEDDKSFHSYHHRNYPEREGEMEKEIADDLSNGWVRRP
jgi:hypothetical protein